MLMVRTETTQLTCPVIKTTVTVYKNKHKKGKQHKLLRKNYYNLRTTTKVLMYNYCDSWSRDNIWASGDRPYLGQVRGEVGYMWVRWGARQAICGSGEGLGRPDWVASVGLPSACLCHLNLPHFSLIWIIVFLCCDRNSLGQQAHVRQMINIGWLSNVIA